MLFFPISESPRRYANVIIRIPNIPLKLHFFRKRIEGRLEKLEHGFSAAFRITLVPRIRTQATFAEGHIKEEIGVCSIKSRPINDSLNDGLGHCDSYGKSRETL